jgi:hypothetical protein
VAGQELSNESFTYVYARVKVLSVVSTWTCLDPGDSAYFNLIEPLSYFDVASIGVEQIEYDDGGTEPLAKLEATGYTTTGGGGSVSIVLDNSGTGSAKNASVVVYALDASNEFLTWTFGQFTSKDTWGPGEQRTATASLLYQAPCPNLRVLPYYDAAEVSASLSPDIDLPPTADGASAADALAVSLLRRRHQVERAKLALLHTSSPVPALGNPSACPPK